MNALEKLYAVIVQQFPNERITTNQAAAAIGLTRGVTSSYLSKLEKQGKLVKTGSRPVYWQIKHNKSAFDEMIGSRGSLSRDIQHAIEAIVYPGYGLPIFITGPRGTGKSTFAHVIFEEAMRRQIFSNGTIFKTIDCSNYKEHPETLENELQAIIHHLSVDKSPNGSYLYIYNIQSLSITDQTNLLAYANHRANPHIRYIFSMVTQRMKSDYSYFKNATVVINLISFNERPLNERITFVAKFLQEQANQVGRELLVSPKKLTELAILPYSDNLSDLKDQIQLLVAAAYAKSPTNTQLTIGKFCKNPICIKPNQELLQPMITTIVTNALQMGPTATILFEDLAESLKNGETITEQSFLVLKVLNQIDVTISERLLKAFAANIQQDAKKYITHLYGVAFPENDSFWEKVTLAFIFANLCSENLPVNKAIHTLQIELKKHYSRSNYLFNHFLSKLNPRYAKNAYYCLPFFVLMAQCVNKVESVHYNAILLTHGESTASSIQQVVNSLCGNYFFEAFDMPIDVSLKRISYAVRKYLAAQVSSPKGNIILFDMGSLRQMFSEIKKVSDQELLVVNNVTTAMALDIGLQIQRNETFQSIAESSKKYSSTTDAQYYEGLSNKKNIIVACMSGVGLSEELKKVITSTLSPSLKVIALDYKKLHVLLKNHDRHFFSNTQLILTTTDVNEDMEINIMNVYNIFDKTASFNLQKILLNAGESEQSSNLLVDRLLRFLSIEGIKGRLQILNPDIVIEEVQKVVSHYEDFYNIKFESRLKLNLYMHLSLMIERMIMNSTVSRNLIKKATLTSQEKEFFSVSSGIFQPVKKKFNIKIQDYEIELLFQLLKDFIFVN